MLIAPILNIKSLLTLALMMLKFAASAKLDLSLEVIING